jgi:hypothetical protein
MLWPFGAIHHPIEIGIPSVPTTNPTKWDPFGAYHQPGENGDMFLVPTTTLTKTGPLLGAYHHLFEIRDPILHSTSAFLRPDEEDDIESITSVDPRDLVSSDDDEDQESDTGKPTVTPRGDTKGSDHDTTSAADSIEESDP